MKENEQVLVCPADPEHILVWDEASTLFILPPELYYAAFCLDCRGTVVPVPRIQIEKQGTIDPEM